MEMQAKMWQKDEKLRQLKEIVQVGSTLELGKIFTVLCLLLFWQSFHSVAQFGSQDYIEPFSDVPLSSEPSKGWFSMATESES